MGHFVVLKNLEQKIFIGIVFATFNQFGLSNNTCNVICYFYSESTYYFMTTVGLIMEWKKHRTNTFTDHSSSIKVHCLVLEASWCKIIGYSLFSYHQYGNYTHQNIAT